jgi:uncharacterized protein (TIGR03435 family)
VLAVLAPLHAQSPRIAPGSPADGTGTAFDVASVKPNRSGEQLIRIETFPGGRFVAINVPVSSLVMLAYRVEDYEIVGSPPWMNSERYDVEARANTDLPMMEGPLAAAGPLPGMIKALLADRFGMVSHLEKREGPIYMLTMARTDGRPGERLTRSTVDCAAATAAAKPGEIVQGCSSRISPGTIVLEGSPISVLVSALSGILRRPIVDKTGLTGAFDLELQWQPQRLLGPLGVEPSVAVPAAPTIFTALREQLGLKLDGARGPVDVLVVDKLERPTSN